MKPFIYISILLNVFCNAVQSQCTDGGLKVQSTACEAPQNLSVLSIGCTEMKVTWTGSSSQMYIVKTMLSDSISSAAAIKTWQVATDKAGNRVATINVKQGMRIRWSVQAVCNSDTYKIYSIEKAGADTIIPFCPISSENMQIKGLSAYPNPAKNFLTIMYEPSIAGVTTFEIYNMDGKKIISKTEVLTGGMNKYRLNITSLPPGTYLLKTSNSKDGIAEFKFVKAER